MFEPVPIWVLWFTFPAIAMAGWIFGLLTARDFSNFARRFVGKPAVATTEMYRIEERDGGYEPQMQYTAGRVDGTYWFPLLETGYWAEPEAFTDGVVTRRSVLPTREAAERAIVRAKAVQGTHIAMALPR